MGRWSCGGCGFNLWTLSNLCFYTTSLTRLPHMIIPLANENTCRHWMMQRNISVNGDGSSLNKEGANKCSVIITHSLIWAPQQGWPILNTWNFLLREIFFVRTPNIERYSMGCRNIGALSACTVCMLNNKGHGKSPISCGITLYKWAETGNDVSLLFRSKCIDWHLEVLIGCVWFMSTGPHT